MCLSCVNKLDLNVPNEMKQCNLEMFGVYSIFLLESVFTKFFFHYNKMHPVSNFYLNFASSVMLFLFFLKLSCCNLMHGFPSFHRRTSGPQQRFTRSFSPPLKEAGREKSKHLSGEALQMQQKVRYFYLFYRSSNSHKVLQTSVVFSEEAAADEKRGKLYKPKSRFETQTKSFLPLETPPQFLALEKRHVSA